MSKGKIERRGRKRRQIKPIVLIVTEGESTEPKYFEHFRTRQTNIDIQVVGNKQGGNTDYMGLVRKAIEQIAKKQLSAASGDTMWVLADGDINYSVPNAVETKSAQLEKARKVADRAGIQIAVSAPCFEFWYLLHYRYTTKYLRDYDAVKAELREYIPGYVKTLDVAPLLEAHTAEALRNAERVEDYHISNGRKAPLGLDSNPYTEVYRLMKTLR